jgi:hypothetical protein
VKFPAFCKVTTCCPQGGYKTTFKVVFTNKPENMRGKKLTAGRATGGGGTQAAAVDRRETRATSQRRWAEAPDGPAAGQTSLPLLACPASMGKVLSESIKGVPKE